MTLNKNELINIRKELYKLSGIIGTHAELTSNIELIEAYDYMSKALDCIENYGYDNDWIDIETNEVK